ncbi:hypothetical protein [Acidiplasma cupricumulans]|uniref:hypothetical protein n=1 Tax=Acidiplasma cupricumulans TaxID=312540 RepID=UPI000A4CEFC4|nr:hypothetical protein [Acidiplasma cupricumulans]
MNLDSFIESEELNDKEARQVKEYIESLKNQKKNRAMRNALTGKGDATINYAPCLRTIPNIYGIQMRIHAIILNIRIILLQ